jgi:hypothetical protein
MPKDEDIIDKILNSKNNNDDDPNKKGDNQGDPDDPNKKDGDDNKTNFVTVEEFQALQKQNKGLIKDLQGERTKRQHMSGKYDQLSTTVNEILIKSKASKAVDDVKKAKGIAIEYDDEGHPYVPQSAIDELVTNVNKSVNTVGSAVQDLATIQDQNNQAKQRLDAVIGRKPEYADVYNRVNAARSFINDKVIEWQKQTGYQNAVSEEDVLTLIQRGDIDMSEFNKTYEGFDVDDIVRSHLTDYTLEKAMNGVLALSQQGDDDDSQDDGDNTNNKASDTFKKVLSKPNSLGSAANNKGSKTDPFERLAQVSADDLLSLTDDDEAALLEAMAREENQEYGS